jgi:hypothetical protein
MTTRLLALDRLGLLRPEQVSLLTKTRLRTQGQITTGNARRNLENYFERLASCNGRNADLQPVIARLSA